MKKKVLLIAAIAAGFFTTNELNAQENESNAGDFKPTGGEKNIEVNFAPLGSNPISINNLRFRYFMSSDMAVRVGFSVSSSSEKTPEEVIDPSDPTETIELEDKSSTFGISINPGIEKHFEGTDRLSPYVGAVLNFSMLNTKEIDQDVDGTGDTYESETTGGSTTFGLNLVLGADWYFSKHFYMGTEVGFGFSSTNIKDDEITNPAGPDTDTQTNINGSSFNLGPNFNSSIRLGFLF
ncbi:MAG: hypothetical protein WD530_01310 [Vicingaceae bacterium]